MTVIDVNKTATAARLGKSLQRRPTPVDLKAFIEAQMALQHGRFFFWSPVFLGLGIAVYFYCPMTRQLCLGLWRFCSAQPA